MSKPYDRATTEPGGMQCENCYVIFVGAEWHDLCGVCVEKHGPFFRRTDTAQKQPTPTETNVNEWSPEAG